MGTAAFKRDAIIEIDGQTYRMLRKVSEICWQLEHTKTARISELEQERLLRLYADRKLTFVNSTSGSGSKRTHIEISETAKLRRLYVLAALKTDTLTDLQQAISDVWRKTNRADQPPDYVSVYRWKKRFLESGSDIRALEDGRHSGNNTNRFPAEVLEICEQSINTVYMRRDGSTCRTCSTRLSSKSGTKTECVPQIWHCRFRHDDWGSGSWKTFRHSTGIGQV